MHLRLLAMTIVLGLAQLVSMAGAQPPSGAPEPEKAGPEGNQKGAGSSVDALVARMMKFDKDNTGKLKRDDITDPRLLRLFDRADANKDGVVTKEELTEMAKKMVAENPAGRGFRGRPGGFDASEPGAGPDGPPPGGRPSGPGGAGGPGPERRPGPPQPGQILAGRILEDLDLSADQKSQLDELQKLVDEKLAKILNDKQKKKLDDMKRRGAGRGGPPPGENGPRDSRKPGPDRPKPEKPEF